MENLSELLHIAKQTALDAGKFLIKEKNNEKKIFSELGRDIKLEIDRSTELLIRDKLKHTEIEILGEEYGGGSDDGLMWVIDPIDGTANYFRGLDQCCVSIALMKNQTSLIGVIFNFNTNEMYSAMKGNGAFLNDKKLKVSTIKDKNMASLTTGFPASESLESSLVFLEDLKNWKKIRMFGSAALSCAYVAAGKCDYYAEKGVFLWDFAAGICLVEEAGGKAEFNLIDSQRYSVSFSNNIL